ncbi:MAG: hypothetical protein ACJAVV_003231 [Alphaproteobacteria bacterium]|jgi:hypothetical protein
MSKGNFMQQPQSKSYLSHAMRASLLGLSLVASVVTA